MATKAVDVILVVGKNKIPVSLNTSQSPLADSYLTVQHLCDAVQQQTNIKPQSQKLIYRGRTLFKSYDAEDESLTKSLSSLGIKNGDRIMVFGKPSADEKENDVRDRKEDGLMKVLDQHQAKIEEICLLCRDMVEKIAKNPGTVDDWNKHKKFFLSQSEYSMQELTRLDATPGDLSQQPDYKTRRKALVNKLLENINMCDNQVSKLTASIKQFEESSSSHKSQGKNS